jgi:hypothetical protein
LSEAKSDSTDWLCRLIGHKYDPEVAEFYGHVDCERCGSNEFSYGILQRWQWFWVNDYRNTKAHILGWITCPSCKWHFGRHDPKNDHIPF